MCSETHYEKVDNTLMTYNKIININWFFSKFSGKLKTLRKISKYIASQNERIYNPKGLQIVDPTYRGLRVIEIIILDRPGRA